MSKSEEEEIAALKWATRIVRERDDLRRILGDRYDAGVAPYRELIRQGMAKHGVDALTIALAIGRAGMARGAPLVVSFAAAALCDLLGTDRAENAP